MEALVAMLLSSVVVILVASVFLVQNQFYADTVVRTRMHENVRGASTYMSAELRTVAVGGVVVAQPDSVVFRYPLVVGGICYTQGAQTHILFPLEGEGVDGSEVDGYAVRDGATGTWTYRTAAWATIYRSSGSASAAYCEGQGADTTGATADFFRLDGLSGSSAPSVGDVVMLYEKRVFKLASSALDPSSVGVYTGKNGGTLMELATGLSENSAFQYLREGETTYQNQVTGTSNLAAIRVIRFTLEGVAAPSNPARDSLSFELTVTVPIKNAN